MTPRFAASILAILLVLPVIPSGPASAGPPAPVQPRIEWIGDYCNHMPTNFEFHDTDRDGIKEMMIWSGGYLRIHDPPSMKRVLALENLGDFEGPIIDDPGGSGPVRIVVFSRAEDHSTNVSVYSGTDFSLVWRNPGWRPPENDEGRMVFHDVADVDGDGEREIVWMANVSDNGSLSARLFVYSLAGEEEWAGPPVDRLGTVSLTEIDGDPAREIICIGWNLTVFPFEYYMESLTVTDGADHTLQWEIPESPGFRFSIQPRDLEGLFQPDSRDINGDGLPDIIVEYRLAGVNGTNESGIRLQNGGSGAVEWDTAGTIPEPSRRPGVLLDIADFGGGKAVMAVTDPDGEGGNGSVVWVLSGISGAPVWDTTTIGRNAQGFALDLDGDGDGELVLSERWNETGETVETAFEALDPGEKRRTWAAGPFNNSLPADGYCYSMLESQDLDGDGTREIVWVNYTSSRGGPVGVFDEDLVDHSFSVLDSKDFSVRWSSPHYNNRMHSGSVDGWAFDNMSGTVFAASSYDIAGGDHRNNTVRIYSMADFRELWNGSFPDGRLSAKAIDLVNDSRMELLVGIDPAGYGRGSRNQFFVLDSRTFDVLWASPGTENHGDPFEDMPVFSGNLSGGPERELVFSQVSAGTFTTPYYYTGDQSVVAVYGSPGFREFWNSTTLEEECDVVNIGDFDHDSSTEILMFYRDFPVLVGFPRDAPWAPGLDLGRPSVSIERPASGLPAGAECNITGTARDPFSIRGVWIHIEGGTLGEATLVPTPDSGTWEWYFVWNTSLADWGSHRIRATATNLLYLEAQAEITVEIPKRPSPPYPAFPLSGEPGAIDSSTMLCLGAVVIWAVSVSALIVYLMLFWRRRKR